MAQRVMLYRFGAKMQARREKAIVPMSLAGLCQKSASYVEQDRTRLQAAVHGSPLLAKQPVFLKKRYFYLENLCPVVLPRGGYAISMGLRQVDDTTGQHIGNGWQKTKICCYLKIYANPRDLSDPERRYSPTVCTGFRIRVRRGNPDRELISTSYMERQNLSVRLFNRRFTRLTLGYSKKFEYLTHSINLMVFHFNFIKLHSTHGQTPAMAAGLSNHALTFEELLLQQD
jgi:hypothetical protein